jgi:hypothetical protein
MGYQKTGAADLSFFDIAFVASIVGAVLAGCESKESVAKESEKAAAENRPSTEGESAEDVAEGQRIFRFETFGDEQLWTDTLHLNEVVEKNALVVHGEIADYDVGPLVDLRSQP